MYFLFVARTADAVQLRRRFFSGLAGFEVSSAGTAADAECPVSGDLIEWADDLVVMERRYAEQIRARFGVLLKEKRLICLNILDRFEYMQDELVVELKAKAQRWQT